MDFSMDEHKEFELLKVNRYEVQENAVFLDYSPESLRKEIEGYQNMKYHIRLSLSKNLNTVEEALIENSRQEQFYSLLEAESKDLQQIQSQLLKFLTSKVEEQKLQTNFKSLLIKPLTTMIQGPYLQIKQNSCSLISKLAHKLQLQEKMEMIQLAVSLSKNDNEQNKIVSLQLLAKMAQDMPNQQKQTIFSEYFIHLYKDSSVRIKREVILELGILVQFLNQEFVDKSVIQNFFVLQCKDNAWGIRKTCVQILTNILKKSKVNKQTLTQILFGFMKDGNKFVRILAYKTIPQFLANYGNENPPQKLINIYMSLIDHEINNQVSRTYQIVLKVSFYFPGVLYTLGPKKWPLLQKMFDRLLHFKNQEIKIPIASSLHEIAKIIGPQQSKQYLFVALDTILKEQSDSLKLTAIKNIGRFVQLFQKTTRQNLIDVFLVLQKDPKKWRVRYSISSQLDYLSKIYDSETIFKYIFPISLKLCNDNVSEVRHEAARKIVYVIENMKSDENLFIMAIQSIKGYALSEKYIQRQTFAIMLQSLYTSFEQFNEYFYEQTVTLSEDKVQTVRISLAISIQKIVHKNEKEVENLRKVIDKLRENEQVAQYLETIPILQKQELNS